LATAAEIVGARLPPAAGEDSVSLLPALLGTSDAPTREATVHQSAGGDLAIRQGAWKLIFHTSGQRELFQLVEDLSETKDVLVANSAVATRLTALMQSYIDSGRSTPGTAQKIDSRLSLPGEKPATNSQKKRISE
jgi:arylsulfatase A